MTIFFTSDLHLGHERIIDLCGRPFENVNDMNDTIVNNWNLVVNDDDTVFVLGDVALGKIDESLQLINKLRGHKLLVPGNHDRCWSGHKKVRPIDIVRYRNVGFTILDNVSYYQRWKLCHFPTAGDSYTEDRYPEFRPKLDSNEWLIHGHVHTMWQILNNQINVGVDVWNFFPVSEAQIRQIITNQDNKVLDKV
jgi:calcineurin-like phosphoesterase family protein